ncbi:transmembrane protein 143 [Rana temporaria]|uniref:transmembrane protein 143 n=1 Tax=Rana temporaria TaxID=8407 RepID=UPI001AAD8DDD|nr:transmembrane protein 143 [Rana temporaria]XP_040181612.1 transmembrane protein 143 [Rana temporaria]
MLHTSLGALRTGIGIGHSLTRNMGSLTAKMAEYRKMWKPSKPKDWNVQYQERYIPFSRCELVDYLAQEFHSSSEFEKHTFLSFVKQLEGTLLQPYHAVLEELQTLYDPINPDRDAVLVSSSLTDSEKLSKEKQVLEYLQPVLDQANFNVLSEDALAYALIVHHPHDGVQVHVNLDKYEYIQYWALGQRLGPLTFQLNPKYQESLFSRSPRTPPERRYFKRVLLAARPKNSHMILKCFKDIPLEGLEQLLPVIKVRTSSFDRTLLNIMLLVSGGIVFVNVGMVVLSDLKIGSSLLFFLFAGFMTFRAWKVFAQRRRANSLELAHMLYYRSTSNNAELLGSLTLRAQEEHAKEVILAHSFLKQLNIPSHGYNTDSETVLQMKKQVESWLHEKSGLEITFSADRALENLKNMSSKEEKSSEEQTVHLHN